MLTARHSGVLALVLMLSACSSAPTIPVAERVDLERFMGDWYVIANIPTAPEKGAHNAVESYRLDDDGSIATTFTFREGAFDGPEKVMRPRGFVRDRESNAVWGMQFIWPIKAEVPDRPRRRGLHRDDHRPQPPRLRLGHGADTDDSR